MNDGLDDDSFVDAQGDRWSNASIGEYGEYVVYVGLSIMDLDGTK